MIFELWPVLLCLTTAHTHQYYYITIKSEYFGKYAMPHVLRLEPSPEKKHFKVGFEPTIPSLKDSTN